MWGLEIATFRSTSKALNHHTIVAACTYSMDLLVSVLTVVRFQPKGHLGCKVIRL